MVMVIQCWSQREQQKIMKSVRTPAKKRARKQTHRAYFQQKYKKKTPKGKTLYDFSHKTHPLKTTKQQK